ncbi:hypothetical protein EII33_02340 [Bacteroides heparinolyticus]|uniref:Uncharacterized protein n=1 Tax=Prevotella heparinolytica TaxID=28113 RepID=A0A3P2ABH0_9BACE|nr:hypothetical protein EII33_02340 [Bacteroides heparinolyticus]
MTLSSCALHNKEPHSTKNKSSSFFIIVLPKEDIVCNKDNICFNIKNTYFDIFNIINLNLQIS